MRPALALAAVLTSALAGGCAEAPPVEPFTVRLEGAGAFAIPIKGHVYAQEDSGEGFLPGDPVRFDDDVDLGPAPGVSGRIEVRPLDAVEASFAYELVGAFEGQGHLERDRRFDGEVYDRGEDTHLEVTMERYVGLASLRVLALRSEGAPPLDVLLRLGGERVTIDATIAGSESETEHRDLRAGAPVAGFEARVAPHERVVVFAGALGGYWNHDGSRLAAIDATVGARWNVVGPLGLGLTYTFQLLEAETNPYAEEVTSARIAASIFAVTLDVRF